MCVSVYSRFEWVGFFSSQYSGMRLSRSHMSEEERERGRGTMSSFLRARARPLREVERETDRIFMNSKSVASCQTGETERSGKNRSSYSKDNNALALCLSLSLSRFSLCISDFAFEREPGNNEHFRSRLCDASLRSFFSKLLSRIFNR